VLYFNPITMNHTRPPQSAISATRRTDWYWITAITLAVLLLDGATKVWAVKRLMGKAPIVIIDGFFQFTYGENTGIAFGLLQDTGMLLMFLAPLAFLILIYFIFTLFVESEMDFWYRLLFGLLIGGAIGNIINRFFLGYVIDFIDVFIPVPFYGLYHWPTFNIADSALCVGEAILFYKILFCAPKSQKKEQKTENTELPKEN
jgi:signal peptidase II